MVIKMPAAIILILFSWLKKGGAAPTFFYYNLFYHKKNKKMEQQKSTIQDKQQLVLTQIKDTPFSHATDGTENYITCGKYIIRTDKTLEETKEWVKEKPWDLIGLLVESLVHEINNDKK